MKRYKFKQSGVCDAGALAGGEKIQVLAIGMHHGQGPAR